jgi:PilZ domain
VSISFHPIAGEVALIEREGPDRPGGHGPEPMAGVVDSGSDEILMIVGVDSSGLPEGTHVLVSIFAREALYRIRATAHWASPERLALDPVDEVERIQRRRWPRHPIELDVTLASLDGPDPNVGGVPGRTLDIGMGGLRVETNHRLPPGEDLTIILTLPDGAPLVARTTVVAVQVRGDVFEYRLAFDQLDELDTTNLIALLDPKNASAEIRRKAASGGPGKRDG